MRSSTLALFFFLVTSSLSAQEGDRVTLKDGSVIRGEVLSLEDGKLQFKTDFSGTIDIELEKVARLEVSRALRFELKGGAVHPATASSPEDGKLELVLEGTGRKVAVELDSIKTIKVSAVGKKLSVEQV